MTENAEVQGQVERVKERLAIVEDVSIGLQVRVCGLEEIARAAGAIRAKINGQLQMVNADVWLGPELRRLDAAFKALER